MVSLFRKPTAEPVLDNRIAGLARRRSAQPAESIDGTADQAAAAVESSSPIVALTRASQPVLDAEQDGSPLAEPPLMAEPAFAPAPAIARLPEPATGIDEPAPSPFVVRPAEEPSPRRLAPMARGGSLNTAQPLRP